MRMAIGLPPGEIVDRLGILELKKAKGADKLSIHKKIALENDIILYSAAERVIYRSLSVDARNRYNALVQELNNCNATLWLVEDTLRALEREQNFSDTFVRHARMVYKHNDQRNYFKREISELFDVEDDIKIYEGEYK
jgi:hypothetical protein